MIKKYLVKKKEHANKDTASEMMLFHCACIELDRNISCFPWSKLSYGISTSGIVFIDWIHNNTKKTYEMMRT